jgi:crossover junction endodeoxyribonuclease RuvC
LVAAQQGLSVSEYSPAKIKRSVGAGGADGKEAVAQMVGRWLKLPLLERHDAYDALAVAICHCNHSRSPTKGGSGVKGAQSFFERLTPNYGPARARAVNSK